MYKIKNMGRMGRGGRERKTNMTAQLACLTQVLIMSPSTTNVGTATKLRQSITSRMAKPTVPSGGRRSGGEGS